jgi:hypothetical protein
VLAWPRGGAERAGRARVEAENPHVTFKVKTARPPESEPPVVGFGEVNPIARHAPLLRKPSLPLFRTASRGFDIADDLTALLRQDTVEP